MLAVLHSQVGGQEDGSSRAWRHDYCRQHDDDDDGVHHERSTGGGGSE